MDKLYIELAIPVLDPTEADLLIGLLSSIGYDGFREEEDMVYACIDKDAYEHALLMQTLPEGTVEPAVREIREENWNALWESSFDPVGYPRTPER